MKSLMDKFHVMKFDELKNVNGGYSGSSGGGRSGCYSSSYSGCSSGSGKSSVTSGKKSFSGYNNISSFIKITCGY